MLTFKEYCTESLGTMIIRSGARALKRWATSQDAHLEPNHNLAATKQAIDHHFKKGNYVQAHALNATLPAKERRGPVSNPWVERGVPNKTSVPGVYQKTHELKFPTVKPDPNTIHLPGKLHPGPKKHQFHN